MPQIGNARYTAKYTETQKQAILRAALIEKVTGREIMRRARTGDLGVPAFEIDQYVYQIIERGRAKFENTNDEALGNAAREELRQLEIAAVAHSRAVRDELKASGKADPDALRKAAKAISEIQRDRQALGNRGKATETPRNGQDDAPAKDVLSGLLDKAPRND